MTVPSVPEGMPGRDMAVRTLCPTLILYVHGAQLCLLSVRPVSIDEPTVSLFNNYCSVHHAPSSRCHANRPKLPAVLGRKHGEMPLVGVAG
jgi:hypothetical protein